MLKTGFTLFVYSKSEDTNKHDCLSFICLPMQCIPKARKKFTFLRDEIPKLMGNVSPNVFKHRMFTIAHIFNIKNEPILVYTKGKRSFPFVSFFVLRLTGHGYFKTIMKALLKKKKKKLRSGIVWHRFLAVLAFIRHLRSYIAVRKLLV